MICCYQMSGWGRGVLDKKRTIPGGSVGSEAKAYDPRQAETSTVGTTDSSIGVELQSLPAALFFFLVLGEDMSFTPLTF